MSIFANAEGGIMIQADRKRDANHKVSQNNALITLKPAPQSN
jgi:hypothetical protein